jgi:hypothetical protein
MKVRGTILPLKPLDDERVLIDVTFRSRFSSAALAVVAACGGTPQAPTAPTSVTATPDAAVQPLEELERAPDKPLLAIDWATTPMTTDAELAAVWKLIAPTGSDWREKLDEIPVAQGRLLGSWMLGQGNFTCALPPSKAECAPLVLDVDPPKADATASDPCLRRMLAMWSIGQLEDDDVPGVMPALRAIVTIPPPESELVASALEAIPTKEQDLRLELIDRAYRAGQRDVANGQLGELDEAHVITAATKFHIDGAMEILSAQGHRAVFLAAIADEKMHAKARTESIDELVTADTTLAKDTKAALVAAAKSKDCVVAAHAARALAQRGDTRFVPTRPRTTSQAAMMRGLCVLAAYEPLQGNDEPSLLASYVPPKGLERIHVAYDALAEIDTDGDGDPHTAREVNLVPRDEVVMPEVDDMSRAFKRCEGTACVSHDRDYRFGFKTIGGQLYLASLEIAERPPCPSN